MKTTRRIFRSLSPGLAAIVLLAGGLPAAADGEGSGKTVRESVEVSDLFEFNTTNKVDGAVILVRDFRNEVVHATVTTNAAGPGEAYSIWWAVFNNPQFCAVPHLCGVGDLEGMGGDPRVAVSVFWAGGFVADASGSANTSLRLLPGRTTRELFAGTKDFGLQNLRGAEIHLVLRSHGPAGIAGPVAGQIGSANDACPASGCVNEFASFHPPRD